MYWLYKPISVLHFQTTLIYILQYHANHGINWLIDWLQKWADRQTDELTCRVWLSEEQMD